MDDTLHAFGGLVLCATCAEFVPAVWAISQEAAAAGLGECEACRAAKLTVEAPIDAAPDAPLAKRKTKAAIDGQ